jgi:hypothetical protein
MLNAGRPRVLIVIPALNEARSIRGVLEDLRLHVPRADLAVIDDGSTDDTVAIARGAGAIVLRLPFNLGIGGALQTGYIYAAQHDYDLAVQFDGDGQHRADQVLALLQAVGQGADLVIGSRVMAPGRYRFPLMRGIGSRLIGAIVRLVTGLRICDPTSGFRAFSRRMIGFFAHHYPQAYLESPEALAWAARHGMIVREIPIEMRPAERSSIGNVMGVFYSLRVCLALLIDVLESRFPEKPAAPTPNRKADQ